MKIQVRPNTEPDVIEKRVLSIVDDGGAKVHRMLTQDGPDSLDGDARRSWALFLNAMFERDPFRIRQNEATAQQCAEQIIKELEAKAQSREEYKRIRSVTKRIDTAATAANLIRQHMVKEMSDDDVLQYLEGMWWVVVKVPTQLELHTSNRPFVINLGQQRTPINFAWLPLSPQHIFFMLPKAWGENSDSQQEAYDLIKVIVPYHNFLLLQERPERLYSRNPLSAAEEAAAKVLLADSAVG